MNTEIHMNEKFGKEMYNTILQYNLNNILEIGSWDGEGSTTCIVNAMMQLSGDKKLHCVEIDKNKFDILTQRFSQIDFVKCFNSSSISYNDLLYKDFEDVWNSPFNGNILGHKETLKSWFDQGIDQLKNCTNSFLNDTTETYDGILIDGSEFTGYSEYTLIKNKTKILFLDDVHNAFKCYQIYKELKDDSGWKLLSECPNTRNGFAIFNKVSTHEN